MNRWLMPFLVTGVVSTIALLTLSPLALSIQATPDTHTVTLDTEIRSTPQPHGLPTKAPLPPPAAVPRSGQPMAETTGAPLIHRRSLAQLLAPNACYGSRPTPGVMRPGTQPAAAAPPATLGHTPGTSHPNDTIDGVAAPPANTSPATSSRSPSVSTTSSCGP